MTGIEIATTVLAAVGGSGVLVAALGAWLGNVWATRISETEKARHTREMETLKSELEVARSQKMRLSNAQFELYSDVWSRLQDLKTIGDRLWERASQETLEHFVVVLKNAEIAINRGRLILPEEQYQELLRVFASFNEYRVGKLRLIEIRSDEELQEHFRNDNEDNIRNQVRNNREYKERYEQLLDSIVDGFRARLGA